MFRGLHPRGTTARFGAVAALGLLVWSACSTETAGKNKKSASQDVSYDYLGTPAPEPDVPEAPPPEVAEPGDTDAPPADGVEPDTSEPEPDAAQPDTAEPQCGAEGQPCCEGECGPHLDCDSEGCVPEAAQGCPDEPSCFEPPEGSPDAGIELASGEPPA